MRRILGILVLSGGYLALKPSEIEAGSPATILSGEKVEFKDVSPFKKKGGSTPWICACPSSKRTCYCRIG